MHKSLTILRQSAMVGVSAIALSALATPAQAIEYVLNGGFDDNSIRGTYSSSFVNGNQKVTVNHWTISNSYTFLVSDGDWITTNMNQSGNGPDPVWGGNIAGFGVNPLGLYGTQPVNSPVASPPGSGWFIATDGAYGADARISQGITGLSPGTEYTLSFWQASGQQQGFTGDAKAWFKVYFGGTELTPAPTVMDITSIAPVSSWQQITMKFTAPGDGLLEFVADGAPSGQPPFALLTGVSITDATPVPLESDALPVVGSVLFLSAGMWWKKKRALSKK